MQLLNASSLGTKGIIFCNEIRRKDLLIIASIATKNLGIPPFRFLKILKGMLSVTKKLKTDNVFKLIIL